MNPLAIVRGDRRTKIVCTIGPSSESPDTLREMVEAGMDVARLNASHGTHDDHRRRCDAVRRAASDAGATVGILVDLQGPKIRTGLLENHDPVQLVAEAEFCITARDVVGNRTCVSTTYRDLPRDVRTGDSIYLADGLLEVIVRHVDGPDVHTVVVHGGMLGEHKGINLPGVRVSAPALSDKDIGDLEFAIKLQADFIAISFVRRGDDVLDLKRRIASLGGYQAVVAKVERPEAIDRFDEILEVTDIVMLARGDLGVELPLDELPQIQKRVIGRCNDAAVPVITATQMLESMMAHPRPTRAEVSDVANAIYDGTDAVMLSGETASGQYPVDAIEVMADIARKADAALIASAPHARIVRMRESGIRTGRGNFGDAICQSASRIANAIGARRIVCFTRSGATAALIARYRPNAPITALALDDAIRRRCAVVWGVDSARTVEAQTADELHALVDETLLGRGLANPGDTVVITGSAPLDASTRTNMLQIHRVGGSGGAIHAGSAG
jgi:pyruvate kinase